MHLNIIISGMLPLYGYMNKFAFMLIILFLTPPPQASAPI